MDENQNEEISDSREKKSEGKHPLVIALAMFLSGALFVGLNLNSIITKGSYYPKTFIIGMILFFFGTAIFIAPGSKKVKFSGFRDGFGELFGSASPWARILWILYTVASIGAFAYIMLADSLLAAIIEILLLLGGFSGLFFAIRHVAILVKLSKKQGTDDFIADELPKHFDYLNPSKGFSIFGIILGLAVSGLCFHNSVTKNLLSDFGFSSADTAAEEDPIAELLDEEYPVHFVKEGVRVVTVLDISENSDEPENYNKVQVKQIASRSLKNFEKKKGDDTTDLENFVLDGEDGIVKYSGYKLSKTKRIKKILKKEYNTSFNLRQDYKTPVDFIKKNLNEAVIYSNPRYKNEFCMVWSLGEFAEYLSKVRGASEDEKVTEKDVFNAFLSGAFDMTVYGLTSLDRIIESMTGEENTVELQGLVLGFGLNDPYYVYAYDVCGIYRSEKKKAEAVKSE